MLYQFRSSLIFNIVQSIAAKTKVLKIKAENHNPIMAGEDHLEEVDQFTYLGSIVDLNGGTDADIKVGIGKVRSAYKRTKNVWNSSSLKL